MLNVKSLSKSYGEKLVLDDVNFQIERGETVGFIGENGSGKTTTMRSIMNIISFDSGEISIEGARIDDRNVKKLGYMPEERGLFQKESLLSQLQYIARLFGLDADKARERTNFLLKEFGLLPKRKYNLGELSLGNQQRVQMMAAMLHNPDYLVLDEPFNGLDPMGIESVFQILDDNRKKGVGILFSSHQLPFIEQICDRVVIISKGKIIANGRIDDITNYTKPRYRLCGSGIPDSWLDDLPAREVSRSGEEIVLEASINSRALSQILIERAVSVGSLFEFKSIRPTLSDVYAEMLLSNEL